MICRIWHGWTTRENAKAYRDVVLGRVIPGIEAMNSPGFRRIDLLSRDVGDEVEFTTMMWFDALDDIRAFMGDDYAVSHVPAGGFYSEMRKLPISGWKRPSETSPAPLFHPPHARRTPSPRPPP